MPRFRTVSLFRYRAHIENSDAFPFCLSTSVEKVPSIVLAVDVVFLVVVKQGGTTCVV